MLEYSCVREVHLKIKCFYEQICQVLVVFQLEAALTMDAVSVIVRGLNNMLQIDPDVFRNTFRRGQVYNNGTRGINCKSDPPIPWKHGPGIMKSFRRVCLF